MIAVQTPSECPGGSEGTGTLAHRGGDLASSANQARRSNRSAFITLVHAATKSFTNFSLESAHA
jgi:hypothetical protein